MHALDDKVDGCTVRDILKDNHPSPEPIDEDALISGAPPPPPHSVYFSGLRREAIRKVATHTQGAAGPSGVDAENWRHMCSNFSTASDALCDALASCARKLATCFLVKKINKKKRPT